MRHSASRRRLLSAAITVPALAMPALVRAQGPIGGRDLLGRTVSLPRPARRIVLAQGRHIMALNLLHPDPASLVLGWGSDFKRAFSVEYEPYRTRYPALANLPVIGGTTEAPAVEGILALAPDLVLASRWNTGGQGADAPLIRAMENAGIPVAIIDFFVQPLRDSEASIALLGTLIGREEQARALSAFHRESLHRVTAALGPDPVRPLVMIHAHAGATPCCYSAGRGIFDDFIRFAGGHNLGADVMTTVFGSVALETLLSRDPAVYVATGGGFAGQGVRLGAGTTREEARQSLDAMVEKEKLGSLSAVQDGRKHGMWHGFNDSPTHLLAIECLARWQHPEARGLADPAASLEAINNRFAAVKMEGTYWLD
ncbi:ABC transporter substrate-binding protein [Pseudoroseomonas globiformis]|uniref:ABC transporter substrate-binding protein n=1 Tax=Teichococcus globiformis TaxID=2307229 RepID=A0ABV7G0J0_9PROT